MLVQLSAQNLVLIEQVTLEPGRGFNVLTGETGAGKSMLVDALGLVLGARARPDMVRGGEREATVEALFEVEPGSRVAAKLDAAGIAEEQLVVRRVIQNEGRSRAFLNGRMCTAGQLLELAPDLCDIASQHESVSLTDPATHLEYLDAFGKLTGERIALEEAVDAAAKATAELEKAFAAEQSRAEREDFLRFQLREIDDLDPRANEEAELEGERGRLRHAEKLVGATRHSADRLYDGEGAMCDELGRIAADVDGAAALDGSLGPLARAIESARAELADAARGLARYAESIESSLGGSLAGPGRLAEVEDRLFRLKKLLRRYGPGTDLRAQREALAAELDAASSSQERRAELEKQRAELVGEAADAARSLSRKRCEAADRLADAIGKELAQLGMGRARVVVEVQSAPASAADALVVDGARLGRSGIDRVEFLIAPNPGEAPRPLRRIASGGELSRSLLALKRVLAEKGPAGLYVFDEVDAGVGGAIAEVIGHAMADVSRHRQVICVTHLPQIAALADTHFVVSKSETRGRTTTSVRKLGTPERVDEVARMIGGLKVGEAARRAAEEMLERPRASAGRARR